MPRAGKVLREKVQGKRVNGQAEVKIGATAGEKENLFTAEGRLTRGEKRNTDSCTCRAGKLNRIPASVQFENKAEDTALSAGIGAGCNNLTAQFLENTFNYR